MRFDKHIFICENTRPPGHPRGCCASKGAAAVRERFKAGLLELDLAERCRANATGCLDACELGVVVVVYPDGVWYGGVTPGDVDEILREHIVGGTPVERLRIAGT
jgi:(2Fe-2S) ferredoxin